MHIAKAFEAPDTIIASRNLWAEARGMIGVCYNDPSATKTADLRSHAGLVVDANLPAIEGLDDVHLPRCRAAFQRPLSRPARRL